MELHGESLIAASRDRVWAALNDPDVLARCIDGVESLTRGHDSDGTPRFDGRMNARVGPVRATFAGGVTLTEVDAPTRYVLVGEGKGGVAGFAKGSAEVTLADADIDGVAGTRLNYAVTSSVGGKLAQLGARLIEGTAKGYAETFFTRLKAEVELPARVPEAVAAPAHGGDAAAIDELCGEPPLDSATPIAPPTDDVRRLHGKAARGVPPLFWAGLLIALVVALLFWELA